MPLDDDEPQLLLENDALGRVVVRLAGEIARLATSDLAELRRMDPEVGVWPPAFWRLLHACSLRDAWNSAEDWAWVVHAIALLTPKGRPEGKPSAHRTGLRFGAVLADSGLSEARLARILTAGLDQRRVALVRLCRRLARSDLRVDAVSLARLLLHRDPESTLRRLADHYYAAIDAAVRRAPEEH